MTTDNDAARALELFEQCETAKAYMTLETKQAIRTALIKSAHVDNDMRIKVLREMGFNHEFTRNEDGSVREHIITHDKHPGLFINHTSLIYAMGRIRLAVAVLARRNESAGRWTGDAIN